MTDAPPDPTTLQAVAATLAGYGDRDAVLYFGRDGIERWTFSAVAEAADALAAGLREQGAVDGPVAVCAANSAEWIIAGLAVWRAGGTLVPLDTQMSDEAMGHVLGDAGVRTLFTQSSEVDRLRRLAGDGVRLVLLRGEHDGVGPWQALSDGARGIGTDAPAVKPDDVACMFYTSGTTGPPKGVPLTHRNLAFQIRALERAAIVNDRDRVLLPLPLHHVYPFVVGMLTPVALGLPVLLPRSLTGPQIAEAARNGRATLIIGVPRLYRALVDGIDGRIASRGLLARTTARALIALSTLLRHRFGVLAGKRLLKALHQRMGPDLRLLVSGGAALKPGLARRLEGLGWTVATGYGLTETAPLLTANFPGRSRFESAGLPVEGVEIRIDRSAIADDPADAEAGSDQDADPDAGAAMGEVLARGLNVFQRYHNLPEQTAAAFADGGWFRTGDLGVLDGDGYLHLGGRRSTMIVTEGGKNVQPDELEEAYQSEPAIAEIVVLDRGGEIVGLIVPDADVIGARDRAQVEPAVRAAVERVSRGLSSYKRLATFATTWESLPRTRLGKPRRHLLAARYDQALASEGDGAAPTREPMAVHEMSAEDRSLLEDPAARSTWQWLTERFPDQRLTPDSDLRLDLGIDSMEWLNITMEISERASVELSEDAIARIETVRDLLEEVTRGGDASGERRAVMEDPEAALSEDQRRWLKAPSGARRATGRVLYGLARAVMATGFRLEVEGREHLPAQGPYVVAPNHESYLDPFAVAVALGYGRLRGTYWAGWTGVLFNNAVVRLFSRIAQVVPIDPAHAVASSLAFGAVVLGRGNTLVWFPEGQRSRTGALQPFKPGLGLLLHHAPVPVVPVVIEGAYEALPPDRRFPRMHSIRVTVHPPVDAADLEREGTGASGQERIMSALHDRMARLQAEAADAGGPDSRGR